LSRVETDPHQTSRELLTAFQIQYPGRYHFVPKSYRDLNAPTPELSTRPLGHCSRLAADSLPRSSAASTSRGCWFPEEPCPVFRPCLTLAVDDAGRRWIAEFGGKDLPGPIWCVFHDPKVAVYISDDLAAFTGYVGAPVGAVHSNGCKTSRCKHASCGLGVMPSRGVPMRSTNRMSRSAVGLLGYRSMPMCMTYALQRSCAAGRTGSWGRRVDCRSLRSPGHPRKAGAKSSVPRFLPGRGHPLIAPITILWTYGRAHERDAKKAPWRRDLAVGVRGCGAVRCNA
jgi:hypothetical protein